MSAYQTDYLHQLLRWIQLHPDFETTGERPEGCSGSREDGPCSKIDGHDGPHYLYRP